MTTNVLIPMEKWAEALWNEDQRNGQVVVIEKVERPPGDLLDFEQLVRELVALRELKEHPNIAGIKNMYMTSSPTGGDKSIHAVYKVYDKMEGNLYDVIRSEKMSDLQFQVIIYRVLTALKYIHSADLGHFDLTPSCLYLNDNCDLQLGGFHMVQNAGVIQMGYKAKSWYRAPEIISTRCMEKAMYNYAVDVWSLGCIIGEVLLGKPLFPGDNIMNQLRFITDLTGSPPMRFLEDISKMCGASFVYEIVRKPRKSMAEVFPRACEDLCDLIDGMLVFDPVHRITAVNALSHPYLSNLHDEKNEPYCPAQINFRPSADREE